LSNGQEVEEEEGVGGGGEVYVNMITKVITCTDLYCLWTCCAPSICFKWMWFEFSR